MSTVVSLSNPRDLDVTEILKVSGLEEDSGIYKYILIILSEHDIQKGGDILDKSKEDLLDDEDLDEEVKKAIKDEELDEKVKKAIVKLRVDLRKADFTHKRQNSGKIDLDVINVKSLKWDETLRLLEETVEFRSEKQRQQWHDYIEEDGIDGKYLLKDLNIEDISKKDALDLNKAQVNKLKMLLEKIRGGDQKASKGDLSVTNNKSTIGAMNNVTSEVATINHRDIRVLIGGIDKATRTPTLEEE